MANTRDMIARIDALLAQHRDYIGQGPEIEDGRYRAGLLMALRAPVGEAKNWCSRQAVRLGLAGEALRRGERLVLGLLPLRRETPA